MLLDHVETKPPEIIIQADGCLLVKTKQAIIVAEYTAPTQHPEAAKVVESLGDYLISVNY